MQAFMNMDCSSEVESNLQFLLEYNRVGVFKDDPSLARLVELKCFIENVKSKSKADR